MKVVSIGTRASTLAASFLLVGACIGGGSTADKAELGVTPADGTGGGGGGGGIGGGGTATINTRFDVTKLTSNLPGVAPNVDPLLQDVWGVNSLEQQFWAAAQETGTLIGLEPDGTPTTHIPMVEEGHDAKEADMTITGIAVNTLDTIQMDIGGNCAMASLIVAAQSGRIWGVNPDLSTDAAFVLIDRSADKAQFTGVAMLPMPAAVTGGGHDGGGHDGGNGGGGTPPPVPPPSPTLLAVDFHNGVVDVFDQNLRLMQGRNTPKFVIPNLPSNFAPFGIFTTDDTVVLTAAQRRGPLPGEEQIDQQVPGDGKGIVAAFDLSGNLLWRVQSPLFNVPWGMALGDLKLCATGALLVGQHGDATRLDGTGNQFGGTIIAMDIHNGRVFNALLGSDNKPARVQGLWGLTFGTDISGVPTDVVHLGAGPAEARKPPQKEVINGLFARLDPVSTP